MIKRRLKTLAIPTIYLCAIMVFVSSMYFVNGFIKKVSLNKDNPETYVDDSAINNNTYIPVVATEITILKPYVSTEVSIYKTFYDYSKESNEQENSIIYYEGTYMQNSGVDYKNNTEFDVVSILDGTVTKVYENEVLGTTVEIRHSNDMISIYEGVANVNVKENDTVLQGQVIAKSTKSKIYNDVENGLHFELYYQGKVVNPEEYYNKNLEDL